MLKPQVYRCVKCKKLFIAWYGGIILTDQQKQFQKQPVCDQCRKLRKKGLLEPKNEITRYGRKIKLKKIKI